jgi:hypothetical protein
MNTQLSHDTPVPGANFRYLRWVAVVGGVAVVAIGVAALLLPTLHPLVSEDGWLESLSWGFWLLSAIVALATLRRWPTRPDRLLAGWTALVALLAFLRELDLHVFLNPKHLGNYAVRYRIDWWLNGDVSFWLKIGWLTVFLALLTALLYPPWALRLRVFRMARRGDPVVGLFFLAVGLSVLGIVTDDLLRGSKMIPFGVRQTVEEGSEMLGAAAFFASTLLRWWKPLHVYVRATAPPAAVDPAP